MIIWSRVNIHFMPLFCDRTMVVISIEIVSPPIWKRFGGSSRAKDSKRKNEQARETCAIKGASDEVRVVLEDTWSVVAQVELRVESDNDPAEQDTRLRLVVRDIACVLDELWEVDLVEGEFANLGNELR